MKVHLQLGRVSNLPTVWTNVLAAGALASTTLPVHSTVLVLLAMSLFYISGMYYNDACDAEFDKQHQPHRPIPSGLISVYRVEAFALAYALIALLLLYAARIISPLAQGSASMGWLLGSMALVACIMTYNRHHKNNPLSPLLMAGCRIAVLLTSCYTLAASLPPSLLLAVVSTLAWLTGLTYLAKREQAITPHHAVLSDYWPTMLLGLPLLIGLLLSLSSPVILIPVTLIGLTIWRAQGEAIGLLIAGICLVDGIFLSWIWGIKGAIISLLAFGLTLILQRRVAGT